MVNVRLSQKPREFVFCSVRAVHHPKPEDCDVTTKSHTQVLRDPDDWKTGDEPITRAQKSYLETLATEAGQEVETEDLNKADASKLIDELQEKTGRGK